MPAVRISDVVVPTVFLDYETKNTTEHTAFVQSGIVVRNPELDRVASEGGDSVEMPFWKDLANEEADIVSDDPDQRAVPSKIATGKQRANKAWLHKSWAATTLASYLAGSNAMARIKELTDTWWSRLFERRIISVAQGVLASNILKNNGDMVIDISNDDAATPGAAQLFSRKAFGNASFTLGDQFGKIQAIAMHSRVYHTAYDNDEIDQVRDSQGNLVMETYQGARVIVDDSLPVVAGVNRMKFVTILFGAGAIGYGVGVAERPVEVTWDAAAANGGGVEVLHTRKNWLVHPFGFAFDPAQITAGAISPTPADLRKGAAWTRVFDERKQIPLAFLVTNG